MIFFSNQNLNKAISSKLFLYVVEKKERETLVSSINTSMQISLISKVGYY
jgi:hypothetical protein